MSNELEKRFNTYLSKTLKGYSHRKKQKYYHSNMISSLSDEDISKISFNNYLLINNESDNFDVNCNQPEKAFTNPIYYKAMKRVPLKQKQVLYLLAVEQYTVKDVSTILNITTDNVYKLKQLAIKNFKKNLEELK